MIHFRQITNADEILALNDYYTRIPRIPRGRLHPVSPVC